MKTPRFKLTAVSSLIVLALGLCFTLPHWWLAVSPAQIAYNGRSSPTSRLYRSRNGEMILRVGEANEFAYWITPEDKKVYSPNISNFSFFSFVAFVWHNDQYGVDLEFTPKSDINPKIVANSHFIEFTSLRKQRIRVSW